LKEFESLRDCKSAIDYGCGEIRRKYGDILATRVAKYAGADVSEAVVNKNRSEGFRCEQVDVNTYKTPYESEEFEGAICCEVFEHLYDPLAAAKEIYRTLKSGGTLVAMVPNFGYHAWRIQALLRAQVPHEPENPKLNRHSGVHIRYFCTATFKRLLTDAGFADVVITAYDHSSIWDITRALGPIGIVSVLARKYLPRPFHLSCLQTLYPGVFAMRLKATATKA